MLLLILNFSDISSEAREKLECLCAQEESALVIDLAMLKPFMLNGRFVERRVWKEGRDEAVSGSSTLVGHLSACLGNAFLAAESALKTPFVYKGIPLWDVLKTDFLRTFYHRCGTYLFFEKLFRTAESNRVIVIRDDKLFSRDLNSWIAVVKELTQFRGIDFLEIKPLEQQPTKRSVTHRILRRLKCWRERLVDKTRDFKNHLHCLAADRESEKIILFGFEFPTMLELVVPVFNRIIKDCPVQLWLSKIPSAPVRGIAEKNGLPLLFFRRWVMGRGVKDEMLCAQARFLKIISYVDENNFFEKCCADVSMGQFLKAVFYESFSADAIEQTLHLIEKIDVMLGRNKIQRLVLCGSRTTEEHICCYLAQYKKTKATVILHYWSQFAVTRRADLWQGPFLSEQYLVLGKRIKQDLVSCGVQEDAIEVTGLPKFNILNSHLLKQGLGEILDKLEISRDFSGVFVWTLQGFSDEPVLLEYLKEAMRSFPEKLLVVRPHPLIDQSLKVEGVRNVVIRTDFEFNELLSVTELLVTGTSITAFESILRDKPVLILNLFNHYYPFPFLDARAAIEVTLVEAIVPTIKRMLEDLDLQQILKVGRREIRDNYHPGAEIDAAKVIEPAVLRRGNRTDGGEVFLTRSVASR